MSAERADSEAPLLGVAPREACAGAAQGSQRGGNGGEVPHELTIVISEAHEARRTSVHDAGGAQSATAATLRGSTAKLCSEMTWPRMPTEERPNWHFDALA